MVNISIDVTDLGGEARPGDKVVLWKPAAAGSATHAGRVISTAPVTVFLTDGKATVSDVEPGEMTVLLQCRGVESQGPVTVTVPDGTGTVTLRSLIESQFEYSPPIVSAVQEAAANASASERAAIEAQVRSEAAADRADAKVDDAIENGANLVRDEVKQDADRAVSARQAATQSESNAAASEGAAASSASNAATSETNAKQSETNAGDYAAVATTAATEAVDAMDSVSDIIGANYATREYVDGTLENLEPRLLGDISTEDLSFAVVDEKNRRTWLEAGEDGKPTDYARKQIQETVDTRDFAFGVVDKDSRRTWLEVAKDGGPTDYARSLIGNTGGGDAGAIPDFPTADWVHWGDSNTDDVRNGAQNWTNVLAGLTGADHYNGGYWGQKPENIAARQGGAPSLITLENNQTQAASPTPIASATNLVVADNADDHEISGTLAGVHGKVTPHMGGVHTFTPTVAGVYQVPPRSVFTPDTGHLRDRHMTIWMGRNGRWDDGAPQRALRAAQHMVDFLTPHVKRFLILQIVPGTDGLEHPRVKDINDALRNEFPAQFVPIAEWMMTEEAATLAGITYTEQDLTDIAEGRIPTSFRRDASHFNEVGCIPIAHFLHREIQERGWL